MRRGVAAPGAKVKHLAVNAALSAIFLACVAIGHGQLEARDRAATAAVALPVTAAADAAIDRTLLEEGVAPDAATKTVPLVDSHGANFGAVHVHGPSGDLDRVDVVLGRHGGFRAGRWHVQMFIPVTKPDIEGRRARVAGVTVDAILWRPKRFSRLRTSGG